MATLFNTKIKDTYQSLLKLEDNTILTTTSKNITDGLGNASPLYLSTTRVGIGTNAPTAQLTVNTTDFVVGADAGYGALYGNSNNGTFQVTSSGNTTILNIRPATGASSYNSAYWSKIQNTAGATQITMGEYQSYLSFGKTSQPQYASLFNTGNFIIGSTTDLSARLGIRGSGSTSATTSLLVQNSAGTTLLQTLDDATTILAGKTFTGTGTILVPSQAHSASDIVMKGDSALISANGNPNQWGKIILCDAGANTTYQNYGQSHVFKIGTTSPTTYLTIAANNITTGGSTRITMGAQDASDIYQGTGANVYGSFLPFGGSGNTVFKNSYTAGSYRFFTAPAVDGTLVEALRIAASGNVLVGTTTDSGHKLRVNGSILASSVIVGDPTNPQGTINAGQLDLLYPNNIRYQSAYQLNIVPKDNSGNTVSTGGVINIGADSLNLLNGTQFSMFIGTLFNGGDRVTLRKLGSHYLGSYLAIEGADAPSYNYGTRSGSVLIYPGAETHGNGLGNVILAHTGTAARGNVGVGIFSPTARLQVQGSGSTSATTSLLVQNSGGTTSLSVNDAGTVTTRGDIFAGTIQIGKGSSTGIYNVAIGQYVLAGIIGSSTSAYTTAIGQAAGGNIASGNHNVIIGAEVAQQSTGMSNSVLIGSKIFGGVATAIADTLAIGTGNTSNYYPTIYATNIASDSPNVRIGNNSAVTAAVPTAPTASAILELSSTTKGFLPPRVTTIQKNAISSPAEGLFVYDTDLKRPCFFNGATWITL